MPKVEFAGQSSRDDDNWGASTSRLINCYREQIGGRSQKVLKPVLGTELFAATGNVLVRAMHRMGGYLYVAAGGNLYRVATDGTVANLGGITDDETTTISSNNGKLTVTAGGNYYVYGNSLSNPSAGAFSSFGSVDFIGQRTILTEKDGRRFQWSDVADPTTLDGANFATTESRDDNNLRVMAFAGILWFFKERSIERWYETGESGANAFAPVSGGALDIGLKGVHLIARTPRAMVFAGADNKVHIVSGGVQPISTTSVETSIAQSTPTDCFYYRDEGHEFVVIRFSDRPAWVFDVSLGEWHERAEGPNFHPWSMLACEEFNNSFIAGDAFGNLYTLTRNQLDGSYPLICQATGRSLRMDGKRFRIPSFEILARTGVSTDLRYSVLNIESGTLEVLEENGGGLIVSSKSDADLESHISLELSGDFGKTWTAPKLRGLGKPGEYDKRVIWRGLGQYRQVTPRLTWSDVTDIPVDAEGVVELA